MSAVAHASTIPTEHDDMIVSCPFSSSVPLALTLFCLPLPKHDAQLDYYSKRLATCSSDRTIRIYDVSVEQHRLIATLQG